MIVQKFGGTSVKDEFAIERLIEIISKNNQNYIIVVSALSGVTNQLEDIISKLKKSEKIQDNFFKELFEKHKSIAMYYQLSDDFLKRLHACIQELADFIKAIDVIKELTERSSDFILCYGEILSSLLIHAILVQRSFDISWLNSDQIIFLDKEENHFDVDYNLSQKAYDANLERNKNYILPGFIASTNDQVRTTLGRGGSDLSASILAVLGKAEKIEIWTDVNGVMTTNPRIIPNAYSVKRLSYKEASELAFFGAKVLHPKTILPAIKHKIPVVVRNSLNRNFPGTEIVEELKHKNLIKGIASRNNVIMINITSNRMLGAYGFLSKVFEVFEKNKTAIDLIATSEVSISLTLESCRCLEEIEKALSLFSKVEIYKELATISVIGEGVKEQRGLAALVFKSLEEINILMISQGASEVNLSLVVDAKDEKKALTKLHNTFFNESSPKEVFYC